MTTKTLAILVALHVCSALGWSDDADSGAFGAKLAGTREVPVNLSAGTGQVKVSITEAPASITFTLQYANLTGNATMAHLHLGNPWESGPIVVTICGGNSGRTCPAMGVESTFTFPLTGTAITAVPAQSFTADVATLLRALRAGVIYANVHTAQYPNGEIRGQVGHGLGAGNAGEHGNPHGDPPGLGNGNGNGNGKGKGKGNSGSDDQ